MLNRARTRPSGPTNRSARGTVRAHARTQAGLENVQLKKAYIYSCTSCESTGGKSGLSNNLLHSLDHCHIARRVMDGFAARICLNLIRSQWGISSVRYHFIATLHVNRTVLQEVPEKCLIESIPSWNASSSSLLMVVTKTSFRYTSSPYSACCSALALAKITRKYLLCFSVFPVRYL